jgi:hypothetical protein
MSAIVNDRDVLLAGSGVRFSPPADRAVLLGASANSFRIAAGGGGSPAAITLSAVVLNMAGNVDWAVTPATALTITGNQAVLKLADMPADSVVVTASMTRDGVTYVARQTIFKTYDGSQGLPGTSTGIVQAYKRAATVPADNPGAITYSFVTAAITTAALANGWSKTIPAGTDPLYVVAASASGMADTDDIAASEWTAPVLLAQSGTNGLNTATVYLYRRTTTNVAPAKPTTAVTYTFASAVASGMDGGWTQNVPADSGGNYLWVTTATAAANTATDTIAANEWAAVRLMAKNGSDGFGYDGQRGTVDVVVQANSWPADTYTANTLFHSSGYATGPYNRDRMTLTNGSFSETRFYDDSSGVGTWKTIAAWINGNMLVSGTLSADVINGGTIKGVDLNINGNFVVYKNGSSQLYTANLTRCTASNGDAPGYPAFSAKAYGTNVSAVAAAIQVDGGDFGKALEIVGGANGIVQKGGGTNWLRTVVPNAQNAFDCGASDFAWRNIYTYGAVITVSDGRLKTAIEPSPLGLAFIEDLRPVSYRMVLGRHDVIDHPLEGPDENGVPLVPNVELVPVEGVRRHYGLIAQEVREALIAHGADDAAFWTMADPADPESNQALRYEELIAPLIRAVQELSTRLQLQEQAIKQLKGA